MRCSKQNQSTGTSMQSLHASCCCRRKDIHTCLVPCLWQAHKSNRWYQTTAKWHAVNTQIEGKFQHCTHCKNTHPVIKLNWQMCPHAPVNLWGAERHGNELLTEERGRKKGVPLRKSWITISLRSKYKAPWEQRGIRHPVKSSVEMWIFLSAHTPHTGNKQWRRSQACLKLTQNIQTIQAAMWHKPGCGEILGHSL